MTSLLIGILSILSYLCSAFIIGREFLQRDHQQRGALLAAWAGAALHGAYILAGFFRQQDLNFGFFNAAALTALFIVVLLLCAALDKPVEKLGIAIFPLSAVILGLDMFFPAKAHLLTIRNWQMASHIVSSLTAFSLLNLAAIQAILLALQEQQLRSHHPKRLLLALPPLQAMETLLFQMIAAGVFFLTVSLLSGLMFIDDLFAQHLVHKTVLSIFAWLIFSALLLGRCKYGWRGAIAVQWTLIGFVLLLLAYFGSKLVLELILEKV